VKVQRTPDAVGECGRYILAKLAEKEKSTLAISGGKSPIPMFEMFARSGFDWNRVQLFWVDERGVAPDDEQSNFKHANEAWLAPCGFPPANIHRIQAELDPATAAALYREEIRKVFGIPEGAIPEFDAIHLGMGPDGHTASLFPGEPMIADRRGTAAALWVEKMKQWRITLLPAVLVSARHTVVLETGSDKREALRAVLEGAADVMRYPAQILREGRDVEWFVSE
jgi:6-phosphogluconolactonase